MSRNARTGYEECFIYIIDCVMLDKDKCVIMDMDATGIGSTLYLLVRTKASFKVTKIGAAHAGTGLQLSLNRKRHSQRMSVWDTTEWDLLARGTVIMDH